MMCYYYLPLYHATTTAVQMTAPVPEMMDARSYSTCKECLITSRSINLRRCNSRPENWLAILSTFDAALPPGWD
jgi:hypothetical protein